MNALTASTHKTIHVCEDCAKEIFAEGGRLDESVDRIDAGKTCVAHGDHRPTMVATSAVVVPADWTAPEREVEPELEIGPLPTTMGPLTEIAARLLVAWTADASKADRLMVAHAVSAAHDLLSMTKGA